MEWPKWLDDFPYDATGPGDNMRRNWLLSAGCVLVSAALGILVFVSNLREYPAATLSSRWRVALGVGLILLILVDLFRLGCYSVWRHGKDIRRVYRFGHTVGTALLVLALILMACGAINGEKPKPPGSSHSFHTYQSSPLAAIAYGDSPGYHYEIVDVKAPFVYDLCLSRYTEGRDSMFYSYSAQWKPWPQILGATALYGEAREQNWLALWEDRIVWVSFDQRPEAKKLMRVLEQLNTWERDSA